MRIVNSRVEWIGSGGEDPSEFVVRIADVPGLANTSMKIARDQVEPFLAILDAPSEGALVGRPVRVTVDDYEGSERITFLPAAQLVGADPITFVQTPEPEEGEQLAIPLPEPDDGSEQLAFPLIEPDVDTHGVPVMESAGRAGPAEVAEGAAPAAEVAEVTAPAAEVTAPPAEAAEVADVAVYDVVGEVLAVPAVSEEDCEETAASLTPADQAIEEQARVALAAAEADPLERRYFLYREMYGDNPRPSIVELTPEEFSLLGGPAYLHLEGCTVVGEQDLSPEVAQGIERLLERATSRPEAKVPRADLERLTAAGHVVSCAVY